MTGVWPLADRGVPLRSAAPFDPVTLLLPSKLCEDRDFSEPRAWEEEEGMRVSWEPVDPLARDVNVPVGDGGPPFAPPLILRLSSTVENPPRSFRSAGK